MYSAPACCSVPFGLDNSEDLAGPRESKMTVVGVQFYLDAHRYSSLVGRTQDPRLRAKQLPYLLLFALVILPSNSRKYDYRPRRLLVVQLFV